MAQQYSDILDAHLCQSVLSELVTQLVGRDAEPTAKVLVNPAARERLAVIVSEHESAPAVAAGRFVQGLHGVVAEINDAITTCLFAAFVLAVRQPDFAGLQVDVPPLQLAGFAGPAAASQRELDDSSRALSAGRAHAVEDLGDLGTADIAVPLGRRVQLRLDELHAQVFVLHAPADDAGDDADLGLDSPFAIALDVLEKRGVVDQAVAVDLDDPAFLPERPILEQRGVLGRRVELQEPVNELLYGSRLARRIGAVDFGLEPVELLTCLVFVVLAVGEDVLFASELGVPPLAAGIPAESGFAWHQSHLIAGELS